MRILNAVFQDYHMEIQVEINGTITVVNIRRQNRIKKK